MSSTEVILLQDLPKIGSLGDVVRVKRGFARNHLVPSGLALAYSETAMQDFEARKKEIIKGQRDARLAKEALHSELDGLLLQAVVQAQEDGSLYGSITQSSVVDLLREQNHVVKRHQVVLPNQEPIKEVGEHDVGIVIDHDLRAQLKFSVLSDRANAS